MRKLVKRTDFGLKWTGIEVWDFYLELFPTMSEREFVKVETSITDSYFWLNELAETLNPYLDIK